MKDQRAIDVLIEEAAQHYAGHAGNPRRRKSAEGCMVCWAAKRLQVDYELETGVSSAYPLTPEQLAKLRESMRPSTIPSRIE